MNNTAIKNATRFSLASLLAFTLGLAAPRAVGAQAAPVTTPPPPVAAAPSEPAPTPAPTPAPEPAPVVVAAPPAEPMPTVMAEPVPEAAPPVVEAPAPAPLPPISVHAWGQVGTKLQNPTNPKKMDHVSENGVLELHFDGQATEEIGLTGNIITAYSTGNTGAGVSMLDLIARFDIMDEFHVWGGRMLVPVDRANFSGAWFEAPWYYPGTFGSGFAGPHEGPAGRNDGVTFWGQFAGGMFKYYAGAFELDNGAKPLWSGRLNLSLINPEAGYYHSSTYYGGKDILAIGLGFQYQKNGSFTSTPGAAGGPAVLSDVDDYKELNVDILFEKNLHESGVIDLEGAFYGFGGKGTTTEKYKYSYLLLASWLTPDAIGPGKIQPLVRFQQAKVEGPGGVTESSVEAQIGYAIAAYDARIALGYMYTKAGALKGNQIYLGAQILK